MDGRFISLARTGPLRSDIGLLANELGPFVLQQALSGVGCVLFDMELALLGMEQS